MRCTINELYLNDELFNEFLSELNRKSKYRWFKHCHDVNDVINVFDRVRTGGEELIRVDDLTDKEIHELNKGKRFATVYSYEQLEINICEYLTVYGDETLEMYSEEDEHYYISGFNYKELEI